MSICNVVSIDVEDYYQVTGFEKIVSRDSWEDYPSRVVQNTQRILEIFAEKNVKGTFFVLGWVAEKFPQLVREIDAAGHEIGSHSYWHRLIYELKPEEFRKDLRRSIQELEDVLSKPIKTFRAPSFSIVEESRWALDILSEEGIRFDSSIFPTSHDRYGIPNAKQEIHYIEAQPEPIGEFPMSVGKLLGVKLPVSGGGYFRLYPYWLTKRLFQQINAAGKPIMFYLHPWEIDPGQPEIKGAKFTTRWRHRVNLSKTENKFNRLLNDFRFGTMSEVFQSFSK